MRALVLEQTFRADLMLAAFALNLVYFAGAVAVFLGLLRSARRIESERAFPQIAGRRLRADCLPVHPLRRG